MCTNLNTNTTGLGFKGKQTNKKQVLIRISLMCTNDKGRTNFFHTNPCLQGPSLIDPVSNSKLPWLQMRHSTGSNTRNQTQISALLDFGSQTYPFPCFPN